MMKTYRKIPFSDVLVKTDKNAYLGRKWNLRDIIYFAVVLTLHLMCLFAPSTFNWDVFWVAVILYVVTGMFGLLLSYHRHLSHSSFKLPKLLEYIFAYCGVHALQVQDPDNSSQTVYDSWIGSCSTPTDKLHISPSSQATLRTPSISQVLEKTNSRRNPDLYYNYGKVGKRKNVGDLRKQLYYRFLQRTYLLHPLALAILLYKFGGWPFVVWGMGVRTVAFYHGTFLVNSVCHIWGRKVWNNKDNSKNNWVVNLLMFGEGWHNNHHAFEFSARHGLEWWEIDMIWYFVKFLEFVGLATDIKVPSESQKQRVIKSVLAAIDVETRAGTRLEMLATRVPGNWTCDVLDLVMLKMKLEKKEKREKERKPKKNSIETNRPWFAIWKRRQMPVRTAQPLGPDSVQVMSGRGTQLDGELAELWTHDARYNGQWKWGRYNH
ncbi:hypothetical protein Sjap_017695 [Stephania japonica]|uniref:Fatty acid desaturase domain-containing protein n=1 Tax=Stephania japonica TaxID=461633 RepID=A0AAP0I6Q8_9MAGN